MVMMSDKGDSSAYFFDGFCVVCLSVCRVYSINFDDIDTTSFLAPLWKSNYSQYSGWLAYIKHSRPVEKNYVENERYFFILARIKIGY